MSTMNVSLVTPSFPTTLSATASIAKSDSPHAIPANVNHTPFSILATLPLDKLQLTQKTLALLSQLIENGINVEVCGSWLWLSGDTAPYKNELREAGFYWASKKAQWYFKPADYKRKAHTAWSMNKIRAKYGSKSVTRPTLDA